MPNWSASLALVAWPVVALYLYRRFSRGTATIWTVLGGFLLLPEVGIKFSMIPAFDKSSIPNLCILCGCFSAFKKEGRAKHFKTKWSRIILLVFIFSPFLTALLNPDPIYLINSELPGVGAYDGFSAILRQAMVIISFIVAREVLTSSSDIKSVLTALVVGGLIYTLPALYEIRMSPQLAAQIYGYSSGTFLSEIRYGGFRPFVFLGNGLILSFFMATCVIAAAALWRLRARPISVVSAPVVTFYLTSVLILCKSAGAILYGVFGAFLVGVAKIRLQMRLALLLACVGLFYPVLRSADLVPTTWLVNIASRIDQDRAASLDTRFQQEQLLLARASERFYFGWGRFGRSRVYTQESGKDDSLTDGLWIITLGEYGIVGFLAMFGLLVLPIFRAFSAIRFSRSTEDSILLSTLSLILAISIVDLLPNASLSCWTWLLAGALLGRSERLLSESRTAALRSQPHRGDVTRFAIAKSNRFYR